MSVEELKAEIQKLDEAAFADLRYWMNTLDDDEWDEQIRRDAESGKLDAVFAEADAEYRQGRTLPAPSASADEPAARKAS